MKNQVKVTFCHNTDSQQYQYTEFFTHFRKAKALVRRQKALGWTGKDGGQVISRTNKKNW